MRDSNPGPLHNEACALPLCYNCCLNEKVSSEQFTQISFVLLLVLLVLLVPDGVVDRLLHRLVVLETDFRISDEDRSEPAGPGSNRSPASRAPESHDIL